MKSSRLLRSMAADKQRKQYLFFMSVVARPDSKSAGGIGLPQKSQEIAGVCTFPSRAEKGSSGATAPWHSGKPRYSRRIPRR